jgi:dTDP-4-amino-4,6-dideoxygalactose transaminase
MMRDHGKSQKHKRESNTVPSYQVVVLGNNYRLTEIQAAFGLAQLHRIDAFQSQRHAHTDFLDKQLGNVPSLVRQIRRPGVGLAYAYYPIRFRKQSFKVNLDQISLALHAEGVGNYPIGREELCHVHPLFRERTVRNEHGYEPGTLPVAEQIASELLILPLYPSLTHEDLDDVVAAVRKVAAAYSV